MMTAASTGAMTIATFRFYEELNDFLPPERRKREFDARCARAATTKHMIEALGVPHTEVELVLVNGESSGFDRLLRHGDRVAVYPKSESLDVTPLLRVRVQPLRTTTFIADAHLGGLARMLRMAGFDTLHENGYADGFIAATSAREGRIVLTRDRDLLKRREITHGMYVRAVKPSLQLVQVFARLDLARSARPFTLCLHCNAPLRAIERTCVGDRVPASIARRYERFSACDVCGRIFWEGTHWQRMCEVLARACGPPQAGEGDPARAP
jgi:hypothetical protein